MKISITRRTTGLFVGTGIAAILAGGVLSAFSAKSPTTLAMWASAYLVLVVGVAQVCFGLSLEQLAKKSRAAVIYWVFGLFNLGNMLVILGSVVKYSDLDWNMSLTLLGSTSLVVSLVLLGGVIHQAAKSQLRAMLYTTIVLLVLCIPIGIILAQMS